ncbi:hypothetical protein [Streptomyces parvulus]|uniref:hypothetical protein n=1 Tax=Streptomyces parvulus TaxID=146923 RepID=UPI0033EF26C8
MHHRDAHPSHAADRARAHSTAARPSARTGGPATVLQRLQRDAGNEAVARAVTAARTDGQRPKEAHPPVQRAAEWNMQAAPTGESTGFGGALDDSDVGLLAEAAQRVQDIMDKAQASEKKVLLFIGVGTGNPADAWGNPTSGGTGGITDESQRSPGFLSKAGEGYTVISVNFNVGSSKEISQSGDSGPVINLTVPARFPLDADGKKKADGAMQRLHQAAGKANRFAVMNAVTQADYQPLIDLVNEKKKGESAYLKSYMQNGETSAFSPLTKKKGMHLQGSAFASMGDVFAADQEQ